jgi:hypothetical protein
LRSVGRRFEPRGDIGRRDRGAHQFHAITFRSGKAGSGGHISPAADRRQKRDFIPRRKRHAPFRELLIDRGGSRIAESGKLRMAAAVIVKEIFYPGAFGDLRLIFRTAYDFLETAKKQDANPHAAILAPVHVEQTIFLICIEITIEFIT